MTKKEKIPKKKKYATAKAIMMAVVYFAIYILAPYFSTSAIETFLPWINFKILPFQFIIIVGVGIIITGFIATYIEPIYPSISAIFNIAKLSFIIWQTLNLYTLLMNISLDVSGFPIADVQLSLEISVNIWLPYLYGALLIGGQGLNIGRYAFQMIFGTKFAEVDHFMLSKRNQEFVFLKNDPLAKIQIDELEPDEKELKEEEKRRKKEEKERIKQEKIEKKEERIRKRKEEKLKTKQKVIKD